MDADLYMRSVLVLVLVLGMVLLAGAVLRRFGPGRHLTNPRGRARRLRVMDSAPLDARRRLVLVRCDSRDHLLLIGGETDLVIDRDIPASDPPPTQPAAPGPGAEGASGPGATFRALLARQTRGAS